VKTLVVLDEQLIRYLLNLVERYGDPGWPLHAETTRQLRLSLTILEQVRREGKE
jgi:hypothetical protein